MAGEGMAVAMAGEGMAEALAGYSAAAGATVAAAVGATCEEAASVPYHGHYDALPFQRSCQVRKGRQAVSDFEVLCTKRCEAMG